MPSDTDIKFDQLSNNLADAISKAGGNKVYLCIWGDGYSEPGEPVIAVQSMNFFSEENGYRDRDRKVIRGLAFGESTVIRGLADVQSIVRVQ